MSVALRPIMSSMEVDARTGQWLSTAFMLTMAVVIPVTGFLLQRFRSRTMYITAMGLFSVGTLIAALSPTFTVLIVGRVVQACGTAVMMPLLMTSLMTLVPPSERGKMMGNVSTVIAVAPATGPMISGVLLDTVGWRGIFWFMLPISLGMLAYGAAKMISVNEPTKVPVDVLSVILSGLGFGGWIYGLSLVGADDPKLQTPMAVCLVGGTIAVALFVWRQLRLQRHDRALLDLRTFSHGQFGISLLLLASMMATLFGIIIVLPLFMQDVLKMEPLAVGLLLLPGGLVMGLLGQVTGRLYDRFGPRPLVVPAAIVLSLLMLALTQVGEGTKPWMLLIAHLVMSVALAFMFTPLFTSSMGAVPAKLYSHASATIGALQQVAGAAGTALFITILASRTATLTASGSSEVAAMSGGTRAAFIAGAVFSLVTVVLSPFIKRPADHGQGQDGHGHAPDSHVESAGEPALVANSAAAGDGEAIAAEPVGLLDKRS